LQDAYFEDWLTTQQKSLEQIADIFDPIPTYRVHMRKDEVLGMQRLSDMGRAIYGEIDPSEVLHEERLYEIEQNDGDLVLNIKLPFVTKEYVDLFKEAGDLVVRIGSFKRHVFLPKMLAHREPGRASLDSNVLAIHFPKPIEGGEEK
jgi:arsenite/tail-anchored protein-transporting ATPase